MMKIKKGFKSKTILLTISIVFLLIDMFNSSAISQDSLRIPMGSKTTGIRIREVETQNDIKIKWLGKPTLKLKDAIESLFRTDEIKELLQRINADNLFLMEKGAGGRVDMMTVTDEDYKERNYFKHLYSIDFPPGINHILFFPSHFPDRTSDAKRIVLKHEIYHAIYFDPKSDLQFQYLLEKSGGPIETQCIRDLDHMDLMIKMINRGDRADAIEYINFELDNLKTVKKDSLMHAPLENYRHIVNFTRLYLLFVSSFKLTGEKALAERLKKEIIEIFRQLGYAEEQIKTGINIAEEIVKSIPQEQPYPAFEKLKNVLNLDYVRATYINI